MSNKSEQGHSPEKVERKRLTIFLSAAFALIALLHFSSVNNEINGLGGDNVRYILVAKSLASLKGYRDFVPGDHPHVHYPPVFPLLLMPVIWLFGVNLAACHVVVILSELAALLFLYHLFKRQAGQNLAILTCLFFALNPFVNLSLVRVLSEFPYLMVTAAALLLAEKAEGKPEARIQYLWLPMLVSAAYLTRTAGLSFFAAFLLYRLYRKEFKLLLWNAPILLIPRILWMIRARISAPGEGYLSVLLLKNRLDPAQGYMSVSDVIERIQSNIKYIAQGIGDFVLPFFQDHYLFVLLLICGLILSGFVWRWIRKKSGLMEFYVLVYLLMLVIWPVYEPRKLMPVMPFIYLYLFLGINWLIGLLPLCAVKRSDSQHRPLRTSLAVRLIGILLIAGQVPPTLELLKIRSMPLFFPQPNTQGYNGFTVDWSHYREAYDWVKSDRFLQNARLWADYLYLSRLAGQISPHNAAIIARKPTLTALYSGRRTIDYPFYRDFEKQRKHILENGVDYILLDGMFRDTYTYLVPYIRAHPEGFQVVARKGNAYILRVLKDRLEIGKARSSQ